VLRLGREVAVFALLRPPCVLLPSVPGMDDFLSGMVICEAETTRSSFFPGLPKISEWSGILQVVGDA
jgi:hypothetical protein